MSSNVDHFLLKVIFSCNLEQLSCIENWVDKVCRLHGIDRQYVQYMMDYKAEKLINHELER